MTPLCRRRTFLSRCGRALRPEKFSSKTDGLSSCSWDSSQRFRFASTLLCCSPDCFWPWREPPSSCTLSSISMPPNTTDLGGPTPVRERDGERSECDGEVAVVEEGDGDRCSSARIIVGDFVTSWLVPRRPSWERCFSLSGLSSNRWGARFEALNFLFLYFGYLPAAFLNHRGKLEDP